MRLASRGDQNRFDSGSRHSWIRGIRILAAASLMALATISAGASNAHDQLCYNCHLQSPAASATPPLWQSQSDPEALMPSRHASDTLSSAACMSCHDGSVASAVNHSSLSVGRTHPVGIPYDVFRNPDLHDPNAQSGLGGSIEADMLVGGRVECISCHDLHGDRGDLLIKSNERSALCLTCHDK